MVVLCLKQGLSFVICFCYLLVFYLDLHDFIKSTSCLRLKKWNNNNHPTRNTMWSRKGFLSKILTYLFFFFFQSGLGNSGIILPGEVNTGCICPFRFGYLNSQSPQSSNGTVYRWRIPLESVFCHYMVIIKKKKIPNQTSGPRPSKSLMCLCGCDVRVGQTDLFFLKYSWFAMLCQSLLYRVTQL